MIKSILTESASGQELYIAKQNGDKVLITQTHAQIEGRFKSAVLTDAGTITIVEPLSGGCITLTDMILASDKTEGATIIVQFNDGTNTETIVNTDMSDAPVNIAINFTGYWHGWRDAWLELIISGGTNPSASCAVGYFKLHNSMLYSEWDALR